MVDNRYLGEDDDLQVNTNSRLPVCLCIDVSMSMLRLFDDGTLVHTGRQEFRDGKMWDICEGGICLYNEMIEGINKFIDAIKNNEQANQSCEVAMVTFSDDALVVEDFKTVDRLEHVTETTFTLGDNTNMAAGVKRALDLLEARKNKYKANGVDYYQPWLVLFTDGEPTDTVYSVQERCKELEELKKLSVFAFALTEDADKSALAGFSNKRKPLSIKVGKLEECFEWLGKSVGVVTISNPGDSVKLDTTDISDWGTL